MIKNNIYLIIADEIKAQIQKEIREVQALKLAPSLIDDLCRIVEDNFKSLEI